MKAFEWASPTTINEAVQLLKSAPVTSDIDEAARPIAGGQDLLTTMKDYTTRPSRVVNLKGIRGLDRIQGNARTGLTIGALVTLKSTGRKPCRPREFSRSRRSGPLHCDAADSQPGHSRRESLSASTLLVLPARRGHLSEEGRLRMLRGQGRE